MIKQDPPMDIINGVVRVMIAEADAELKADADAAMLKAKLEKGQLRPWSDQSGRHYNDTLMLTNRSVN